MGAHFNCLGASSRQFCFSHCSSLFPCIFFALDITCECSLSYSMAQRLPLASVNINKLTFIIISIYLQWNYPFTPTRSATASLRVVLIFMQLIYNLYSIFSPTSFPPHLLLQVVVSRLVLITQDLSFKTPGTGVLCWTLAISHLYKVVSYNQCIPF